MMGKYTRCRVANWAPPVTWTSQALPSKVNKTRTIASVFVALGGEQNASRRRFKMLESTCALLSVSNFVSGSTDLSFDNANANRHK